MEEEEGGGPRLSKRFSDDKGGGGVGAGEMDYKTKAGTAWSHSYLNQKPWHPLSYPNQRRKWIAEQTNAQRDRRAEEVAREFSQEQEFFRQTALVSNKEKEKMEMMKAVSFMYVRPPGYNAESAKAAEIADEKKKLDEDDAPQCPNVAPAAICKDSSGGEKKKTRPKDVFGRALPTEEEFEVLKNAPRLETGLPARIKPFAVEVRNVRCVRCGTFGHQSGDRECPLKDAIMPNEESRLRRDDPLTAIMARTDSSEALKWELKQKPGMSPPRGGFGPDDPNQQIVAEDIFDEYGGFLSGGGDIPDLLLNSSGNKSKKHHFKKKSKHKLHSSGSDSKAHHCNKNAPTPAPDSDTEYQERRSMSKRKKRWNSSASESSEDSDQYCHTSKRLPPHSSKSDHIHHKERRRSRSKHKKRTMGCESDSSDSLCQHRLQKNHRRRRHRSYSTSGSE